MLQPVARTLAPACDDNAFSRTAQTRNMSAEHLEYIDPFLRPLRREVPALPASEIDACTIRNAEWSEITQAAAGKNFPPLILRKVERIRLQRLVAGRVGHELCGIPILPRLSARVVVIADEFQPRRPCLFHLRVE